MRPWLSRLAPSAPSAAAWLAAALLWTAAFARTLTYLNCQDVALYVRLGRLLAETPIASPEWMGALRAMTPLHSLLLAAVIRLFGVSGAFWMNYVLGLAWLGVLCAWGRRLGGAGWRAVVVPLAALAFVLATNPRHAASLLLPFREMPSILLGSAGLLVFLDAWRASQRARLPVAGLLLLLATAAREPTVFAVAGPALALLLDRRASLRARAVNLGLLLSPFLAVAALAAVLLAVRGQAALTDQMRGYLYGMGLIGTADLWRRTVQNLAAYGRMLVASAGWAGVALLGAGAWPRRGERAEGLLLLLVPALLMAGFYSTFEAHARYFLAFFALASPLFGAGVLRVFDLAARLAPETGARLAPLGLRLASAAAVAWVAVRVPGMDSWGPRYARADVARARNALRAVAKPGDVFHAEVACRDLCAFLSNYTRFHLAQYADPRQAPGGAKVFHLQPLNRASIYDAVVQHDGVAMNEWLRTFGDLVTPPGLDAEGRWRLGPGEYALRQWLPFSARVVRVALESAPTDPPDAERVWWLDLRAAATGSAVRAHIVDAAGRERHRWAPWTGGGLMALYAPRAAAQPGPAWLVLESETPLPAEVAAGVQVGEDGQGFAVDNARRLSVEAWFAPPFIRGERQEKYGAMLMGEGRLTVPAALGIEGCAADITLTLSPAPRRPAELDVIAIPARGLAVTNRVSLNRAESRIRFPVAAGGDGGAMEARLVTGAVEGAPPLLRVKRISVRYLLPGMTGARDPSSASTPGRAVR